MDIKERVKDVEASVVALAERLEETINKLYDIKDDISSLRNDISQLRYPLG